MGLKTDIELYKIELERAEKHANRIGHAIVKVLRKHYKDVGYSINRTDVITFWGGKKIKFTDFPDVVDLSDIIKEAIPELWGYIDGTNVYVSKKKAEKIKNELKSLIEGE